MTSDIQNVYTNTNESLDQLANEHPVLLVFLRHFGCIFCREALDDLSKLQEEISERELTLIFVHMSSYETAEKFFQEYNLKGVRHISDPQCELYAQFGLTKGSFGQLFGLSTWIRGFELKQKGMQYSRDQIGDSFQMPGVFLLYKGETVDSYIHKSISDKPDYSKMIQIASQL